MKVKAYPVNYREVKKKDFNPDDVWYAYIVVDGKQIRYKKDINRIKNLDERKEYMADMIDLLKEKLKSGWNPQTKEYHQENTIGKNSLLKDALDFFIEIKKQSLRPRSIVSYTSRFKVFKLWLDKYAMQYVTLGNFSTENAQKYMDYLSGERGNSPKTFNNALLDLRTVFNFYIQREIIAKNPFKNIRRLQVERGKNNAYTPEEMAKIDEYLIKHNIRLYYFKEFIYCCGIRRTEMCLLQVRDIREDTIIIRSENSKNKNQETVVINKRLKAVIEQMNLGKYEPTDYVFGKDENGRVLITHDLPISAPNYITELHKNVLVELGIRKECNLYSWKHTGAVNLYKKSKDMHLVMRHLRHRDLKTTLIYLRSLGVSADESLKDLDW